MMIKITIASRLNALHQLSPQNDADKVIINQKRVSAERQRIIVQMESNCVIFPSDDLWSGRDEKMKNLFTLPNEFHGF